MAEKGYYGADANPNARPADFEASEASDKYTKSGASGVPGDQSPCATEPGVNAGAEIAGIEKKETIKYAKSMASPKAAGNPPPYSP